MAPAVCISSLENQNPGCMSTGVLCLVSMVELFAAGTEFDFDAFPVLADQVQVHHVFTQAIQRGLGEIGAICAFARRFANDLTFNGDGNCLVPQVCIQDADAIG